MFDVQPTADVIVNFGTLDTFDGKRNVRFSIGILSTFVESVEQNKELALLGVASKALEHQDICYFKKLSAFSRSTPANEIVTKGRRWNEFARWVKEWQSTAVQMRESLLDVQPEAYELMIRIHTPNRVGQKLLVLPYGELRNVIEHFQSRKTYTWREAHERGILTAWRALMHSGILKLRWTHGTRRRLDAYSFVTQDAPLWEEFVQGMRGIQGLVEATLRQHAADPEKAKTAPPITLTLGAILPEGEALALAL